jgi:hypothetical protein
MAIEINIGQPVRTWAENDSDIHLAVEILWRVGCIDDRSRTTQSMTELLLNTRSRGST